MYHHDECDVITRVHHSTALLHHQHVHHRTELHGHGAEHCQLFERHDAEPEESETQQPEYNEGDSADAGDLHARLLDVGTESIVGVESNRRRFVGEQ